MTTTDGDAAPPVGELPAGDEPVRELPASEPTVSEPLAQGPGAAAAEIHLRDDRLSRQEDAPSAPPIVQEEAPRGGAALNHSESAKSPTLAPKVAESPESMQKSVTIGPPAAEATGPSSIPITADVDHIDFCNSASSYDYLSLPIHAAKQELPCVTPGSEHAAVAFAEEVARALMHRLEIALRRVLNEQHQALLATIEERFASQQRYGMPPPTKSVLDMSKGRKRGSLKVRHSEPEKRRTSIDEKDAFRLGRSSIDEKDAFRLGRSSNDEKEEFSAITGEGSDPIRSHRSHDYRISNTLSDSNASFAPSGSVESQISHSRKKSRGAPSKGGRLSGTGVWTVSSNSEEDAPLRPTATAVSCAAKDGKNIKKLQESLADDLLQTICLGKKTPHRRTDHSNEDKDFKKAASVAPEVAERPQLSERSAYSDRLGSEKYHTSVPHITTEQAPPILPAAAVSPPEAPEPASSSSLLPEPSQGPLLRSIQDSCTETISRANESQILTPPNRSCSDGPERLPSRIPASNSLLMPDQDLFKMRGTPRVSPRASTMSITGGPFSPRNRDDSGCPPASASTWSTPLSSMALEKMRRELATNLVNQQMNYGPASPGFLCPTTSENTMDFFAQEATVEEMASFVFDAPPRTPQLMSFFGILPLREEEDMRWCSLCAALYQKLVVLLTIFSLASFLWQAFEHPQSGSCERFGLLSDLPVAAGSVIGLLMLGVLSRSESLRECYTLLFAYADREGFLEQWQDSAQKESLGIFCVWILANVVRLYGSGVACAVLDGHLVSQDVLNTISFMISSGVLLGMSFCIVNLCRGMANMIDMFCCRVISEEQIITSVAAWNILEAVMRKVSGVIEHCFFTLQIAATSAVMLFVADALLKPLVASHSLVPLIPGALVILCLIRIFFYAAQVTDKCNRVPALVNSISPDIIDHERKFVVEHILHSAAGFYVFEVRVTSAIVLKFSYMCLIVVSYLTTKVFSNKSLFDSA